MLFMLIIYTMIAMVVWLNWQTTGEFEDDWLKYGSPDIIIFILLIIGYSLFQ